MTDLNQNTIFNNLYNADDKTFRFEPSGDLLDSALRQRVSNSYTLFANKNLHSANTGLMKQATSGGTETITYLPNESAVNLAVGTASGEYIIRQSRHVPYVPGKGIRVQLTGVLGTTKLNNVQEIGYHDDLDGLFFKYDINGLAVVRRTSVSGSADDSDTTYQSNWNLDNLSGTGGASNPSGKTLDISKIQLFLIDALWQGAGEIRFGLIMYNKLIYVHKIDIANILTAPSFMRPSLPLRYKIYNSGVTASATTLKEICCEAESEGGFQTPGLEFAAPGALYVRNISAETPIMAIRLKATLSSGKLNRITARLLSSRVRVSGNADAWFTMHHVHDASITGGSWVSAGADSGVEYNVGLTSYTGAVDHVIDAGPVTSGVGGQSNEGVAAEGIFNEHGLITMNITGTTSQALIIVANTFAGAIDITAAMKWAEFD